LKRKFRSLLHPCEWAKQPRSCIYINAALVLWAYNVCADPKHPIGDLAFTRPIYQRSNVVFEPRLRKGNMEAIKEMLKDYGGDA